MKKILLLLSGWLFLLGFSSCSQQEEETANAEKSKKVTIGFDLSDITMTPISRAGATEALRFVMEVWTNGEAPTMVQRHEKMTDSGSKSSTFTFELEQEGDYRLMFWADYIDASASPDQNGLLPDKYYSTSDIQTAGDISTYKGLTAVKLNAAAYKLNQETRDAFYAVLDFTKTALEIQLGKQTLKRAVGKLVLKEKSKEAYERSKSMSVSYQIPTTFNVVTGRTVGTDFYTVNATDISLVGDAAQDDLTLCYDYIFTSAGETGITLPAILLTGKSIEDEEVYEKTIPAGVPVRQNKRTVLSGTSMLVKPLPLGLSVTVDAEIFETWDDDITVDKDKPVYFEGEGTTSIPYKVQSGADLQKLAELVKAGTDNYAVAYYEQTADIAFNGTEKINIGTSDSPFKGTYDGKGWTIDQVISTEVTLSYTGLFAVIDGATLKNIRAKTVKNLTKPTTGAAMAVGGVCGVSRGVSSISNISCDITNISGAATGVGAICGKVESGSLKMSGCKVTSGTTVTFKTGLAGTSSVGSMIGLVSSGAAAEITDCYNTVRTSNTDSQNTVGGICGKNEGTLAVSRCFVTGALTAASSTTPVIGIIVGQDTTTGIADCYYAANATVTITNGAKKFTAANWPAWSLDDTAWKSLGDFASTIYPTLDWE